jgi:cytochrome c-type biogenesis protein CcsB
VERAEVICFWLAFLSYAAALVFFVYYFVSRRESLNRVGIGFAVVGFALQVAVIALRDVRTGHMPVVGTYESLLTISWALMVVYLLLEWRTRIKALGLYVMPLVLVFLAIAWAGYEAPAALQPALESDLVILHVLVIFTSVAAFVVAGGAAVIYLVEERQLKSNKGGRILGRLPSLQALDRLVDHAVMFGLPFLTMGIVTGALRAQSFGVSRWYTDPFVLLTTVAWLVYVAFLALRHYRGWRGRRSALLAIVGLVCLLLIRFVAIPYLTDFHTWGS